jgi:uncharacterized protein (TIGR02453 family)
MASEFPGFPPETLEFLHQLARNNNRGWFQAHKVTYEEKVKTPMIGLVLALGGAMQSFAPEMIVDPKRAIFRIYRDTRFSRDKAPYKTQIAAIFGPRGIPKHRGTSSTTGLGTAVSSLSDGDRICTSIFRSGF